MDGARRAGPRSIEIRLLGPIEADRDGQSAHLGGPKPRALLAVLALSRGHVVSVDRLVEALWPADAPDTAAHAVQVYVSQLRKTLGQVIVTRPPGYVLELDAEAVDLDRFRRLAGDGRAALDAGDPVAAEAALREALALWHGPPLADFAYEPFAQTDIARLEEHRAAVLEERIEADLALGRHGELVSELEALVQAQPHRERPRAQLMLALYRSGRQAEALAAYRSARETLVEELGIEPGPELRDLEAAILRQDASLILETETAIRPSMQFRRLASILFVDVVESMALGERLDPEALGSVQRRYFETVSAALTRHGGTVEKYAGDAVMAAFGVPISHEDDALRAARGAFEIREGIAALNERLAHDHDVTLEIRIGIAAGEVVSASVEGGQRFVAGDPVGIAARLQHEAGPGEVVVGEVVARLIDHAARLEPRGELEIPGRQKPFAMFTLQEITPAAPAFERRLDAKLVGRKRELAAIRKALKRAVHTGSPELVVVTGVPGVGKSRLAAEVASRARGVSRLSGRCLSYGDGITYWPLREVLEGAPPGEDRDAVLAALQADTPPPEIAWLFRRFCEQRARERPLVLVFDDAHWAEPTFLELVEHLVDRGEGPILVLCVAREELLEERPALVEERKNATLVEVDALPPEDADALFDGLASGVLDTDRRDRIVEAAEGNPFFLEQLVALELEGALSGVPLPETIQALLASRLERLGPGERAVLERGAVIGKEFRLEDVVGLLEPEAAPTAEAHVSTLTARGFVRPVEAGEFAFRHVLLQEAVYRAAPKRLRADLHERFVDRFETRWDGSGDLDEFAGYHLEQAYRLRTELGESDRHVQQLGEDAGRRLGDAGVRASKRADAPAAVGLLRRAISIPAVPSASNSELLTELGIVLRSAGDVDGAVDVLDRAADLATTSGDRKAAARARMERAYARVTLLAEPGDELLDAIVAAIPLFEAADDDRLLGRARLLSGWMQGGRRGQNRVRLEAAETALDHYRRSSWPISTAVGEIASALYYGPVPVADAIDRCEELLRTEALDLHGRANLEVFLGGEVAQTGDFERAKALIASATAAYDELGQRTAVAILGGMVRGDVDLLARDDEAAAEGLRRYCGQLEAAHARSHVASVAGSLAEALYRLDRLQDALEWTEVGERHSAPDDVDARVLWMPVRAKTLARRGGFEEAEALAREAVGLARTTDTLNRHAKAERDHGEVLALASRPREARVAFGSALELYEAKGNVVEERRLRALLDDVALV